MNIEKQAGINRNEIKYYISKRQAVELSLFLRNNMSLDSNADAAGSYWIRSLYFDTIDNKDYYEKIIGHNIRKKIRLRIYNLSAASVKLEIKNKSNSYTHKETAIISCEDARKLIQGDCNPLLNYNERTANKVFAFMHRDFYRPAVIIDYQREAYFYPFQNIRVTIDKNICASFNAYDLFRDDICMLSVFNDDVFVLEIKYDHMIPCFLQKVLSTLTTEKSHISKYCLGRSILGI